MCVIMNMKIAYSVVLVFEGLLPLVCSHADLAVVINNLPHILDASWSVL